MMSDTNSKGACMRWQSKLFSAVVLTAAVVLFAGIAFAQEPGEKTFATPQEAGKALYDAAKAADKDAIVAILGATSGSVVSSGDEVADKNTRDQFTARYEQMNRWAKEINGNQTLIIGAENWPFPIPLKKDAAGTWYFDTKAGLKEILFRRIGKNELAAIRVCGVLADAQDEYFSQKQEYAQKFSSDPGKQNGLYWKADEGQPESPVGPLVAYATGEGYGGEKDAAQPFHGYYYHMLKAQGASVKGGAKSYIVDGKMTGGFAFVAYPAEYRNSGVMTFLVDQNGTVYEKDLGPQTADLAKQMKAYNPDKTWKAVWSEEESDSDSE
jgi:Protein of unknown function (DUF2950)